MYYAQIDADGLCYALTQTSGTIDKDDMVEITEYDESLLGKQRVGDEWIERKLPEQPLEPKPPTIEEKLDALGVMLVQLMLK